MTKESRSNGLVYQPALDGLRALAVLDVMAYHDNYAWAQGGPVSGVLEAVDDDLTPGRFLSNIWHSFEYTRLEVPSDPIVAEQRWCPPP